MELIPHLRCHSEYSISHGMVRLSGARELGRLAAERGIGAVALTDTNNVYAAIRHQATCLRHGVKPILGCHALLQRDEERFAVSMLCEDATGFGNLSRLLTTAQLESDARIDATQLAPELLGGLTVLVGYGSDVADALHAGRPDEAGQLLAHWRDLLPPGRACVEVSRGGRLDEEALSRHLGALAQRLGVPAVAAHPINFTDPGDYEHHEVRTCIATGTKLNDPDRRSEYTPEMHFLSAAQMRERFADWPGPLANAAAVARRCNYDFNLHSKPQFPQFDTPSGDTHTELRTQAAAGLVAKIPPGADPAAYERRLEHELEVIIAKGFADYFLIVADFIRFANAEGIPVGPGRGSGAGSLVAYSLGITGVDPLRYDLLFERFLNPERTALPDFDIDFCKQRRGELFARAQKKYGADHVSQVVTFGSLKAKAAVRDCARALGQPHNVGDRLARLVPDTLNITLAEARMSTRELDTELKRDPGHEEIWRHCLALEGLPRQPGTHAAAILIAPQPLPNYCPLALVGDRGDKDVPVSQYDMGAAEAIGLIKFDFLGLKNLTMLRHAERLVQEREPGFTLAGIDVDDDRSMALYREGNTGGVFQCESDGMIRLMRQVGPRRLDDVALTISMYRPGVLKDKVHEEYLKNRADPERITYPHEKARPVLAPTCGVMIYQEQVMRMSQVLAGFSLGEADNLRKAMGKKSEAEMDRMRVKFIAGCGKLLGTQEAHEYFDKIKKFAGYGFNKSHAVAYALLSVQTAYLKAHHPAAFYAAALSTWSDDQATQRMLIDDAGQSRNGVRILPPCVNASAVDFTIAGPQAVRFGLGSVRGVGARLGDVIAKLRERDGPVKTLEELCLRIPIEHLNERTLENLVQSGACDCLAPPGCDRHVWRPALWPCIKEAIASAAHQITHKDQAALFAGDDELAAAAQPAIATIMPWHPRELLDKEIESLGRPLTVSLADLYAWLLHRLNASTFDQLEERLGEPPCWWLGMVVRATLLSRHGQSWYAITLTDSRHSIEVHADPSVLEGDLDLNARGQVVMAAGAVEVSKRYGNRILRASQVLSVHQWVARHLGRVDLRPADAAEHAWVLREMGRLARECKPGPVPVRLRCVAGGLAGFVDLGVRLRLDADDLLGLRHRLGDRLVIGLVD